MHPAGHEGKAAVPVHAHVVPEGRRIPHQESNPEAAHLRAAGGFVGTAAETASCLIACATLQLFSAASLLVGRRCLWSFRSGLVRKPDLLASVGIEIFRREPALESELPGRPFAVQ